MGKQFFICTGFINLLNKALFKWLVQGSPSTLPDPNVQSKLMKGHVSWWPIAGEGVCAVMLKNEGGYLHVRKVPSSLVIQELGTVALCFVFSKV